MRRALESLQEKCAAIFRRQPRSNGKAAKLMISAVAGLALLPAAAHAGGGALVTVCIDLTKRVLPTIVTFRPEGNASACMVKNGQEATLLLKPSSRGLVCTDVGYVENKSSTSDGDTCATDDSEWVLQYFNSRESDGPHGIVKSHWGHPMGIGVNWAKITDYSGNASENHLCDKKDPNKPMDCTDDPPGTDGYHKHRSWDDGTVGHLYFVFKH